MGRALDQFGSVVTAMITAFDEDGELDLDATVSVAKYLETAGNSALVVSGTTGEASTLTDDEKLSIWDAVSSSVNIPVIAGSGSNDTLHSVSLTKQATKLKIAGVLAVAPYYNRPPQSGIFGHIREMANATDLPVIIYDIPVRTGRKIATSTIFELANSCDNIVGLKDAAGDPSATATVIAGLGSGFDVYSGDDAMTLPLMAVGAIGAIGVATHWASEFFSAMIEAFNSGDHRRAMSINAALFESYGFETGDFAPNPMPTKVMMNEMGFRVGQCRLPMGAPPLGLQEDAKRVLANLKESAQNYSIKVNF
ncbi:MULTISPECIES: 4-hydroxy-tetrahydrodipicolinate synthase [Acidithrix]|uniref:4-hydroxy-tetrahydrodipicolinate synthase n=1 Tax=Acidithrix ferrooxidans TaxID=1280514 RepID=A0A0D8HLW6_9ACTN|nr:MULTISPECIES: 4-hydroxy-tetrahydrodipicolinate synthase [Acidithrix]KJF18990.1 4-hydroxy-tetrahydrodipicolinate synthase [Acidithrix ferrooxidans]CAG4900589.1 unnamed protein product [Acidithrix sp. C25]